MGAIEPAQVVCDGIIGFYACPACIGHEPKLFSTQTSANLDMMTWVSCYEVFSSTRFA
jgi:hypothetical protein